MKIIKNFLFVIVMLPIVLSGCSEKAAQIEKSKESTTQSSEVTSSTSIEETQGTTSESSEKMTKADLFQQLPDNIKAQIYTQIVDSRIELYRALEGMQLSYAFDNDDIYVHLTSGVGTGHPIYRLYLKKDEVEPLQGVYYSGVDGNFETPVEREQVSLTELYDYYEEHIDELNKGAQNVTENKELRQTFIDYIHSSGAPLIEPNDSLQESKEVVAPSREDILLYFREYVLSDLGVDPEMKEHVHYGVGDDPEYDGLIIRYGGGMAAYVTVEGSRIIYTGYSFGGVYEDGTVEKTPREDAFYDMATGEHGLLE